MPSRKKSKKSAKTGNSYKSPSRGPLAGYEVLLCVTGGIACYKVADLASKLVQTGAGVTAAMTEAAEKFVAPLTFAALTNRQVFTDMWLLQVDYDLRHISLTDRADLIIIAPATANILGKMAAGIADDLISTMALSAAGSCDILAAPAMNSRMWNAASVRSNVETLNTRGLYFVGPDEGRLASGAIGLGRMAETDNILKAAQRLLLRRPPKNR